MSFFDRNEGSPASGGDFASGFERGIHHGAVRRGAQHMSRKPKRTTHRGGLFERHMKISGDGTGRLFGAARVHEVKRRGPIAVTIEKGTDDAAVKDAFEGEMMGFRPPLGHHMVALHITLDAESLLVRRSATETAILRGVGFLKTFHGLRIKRNPVKASNIGKNTA